MMGPRRRSKPKQSGAQLQPQAPAQSPGKPRVAIDAKFFQKLRHLLRIVMPGGFRSKEFVILALEALLVVANASMSLYIARLDGQLVSLLVQGKSRKFLLGLLWWLLVGLPASFLTALLSYLQRVLACRFRARMTAYLLRKYLPDSGKPVYYAIHNLDNRIHNADQILTADVMRFTNQLSSLFVQVAKPFLEMTLYTYQLCQAIGGDSVYILGNVINASSNVLRLALPPFGDFVATEARLEGIYRNAHSRLVEYSEEIAFYDGHRQEKDIVDRSYYALAKHIIHVLRKRFFYHFLETFTIKYYWGALGLALCSLPAFVSDSKQSIGKRTEAFVTNRRMLMASSEAFGRITSAYKDVSQLAGYTEHMHELIEVMNDVSHGRIINGSQADLSSDQSGEVRRGDDIEFIHVPLVSPAGTVLVKDLTFKVKQGQHLLIVGPNGCGKSSLFRLLGGLWRIPSGVIVQPPSSDIFYIPQRPYLSRGTLRQQVIYPTTEANNTVPDEELSKILRLLKFEELVAQVGGWDARREWREDLSIGVQQRIAAARLFYHKPKFAILDECTSSVTLDIETIMYTNAKAMGISLLTVSHRASLWKYHNLILQFDGHGGYIFTDLDAEARLRLEEEKLHLEQELRLEDELRERLQVLESTRAVAY